MCQQGGEIILCDTCPKAYHLVCLDPELETAPEGEWFCPTCEKDGIAAAQKAAATVKPPKEEKNLHAEHCHACRDGGELICCSTCTSSWHMLCLTPQLKQLPDNDWLCPKCTCEPLKAPVKKIFTWRWKSEEGQQQQAVKAETRSSTRRRRIKKINDEDDEDDDDDSQADREDDDDDNDGSDQKLATANKDNADTTSTQDNDNSQLTKQDTDNDDNDSSSGGSGSNNSKKPKVKTLNTPSKHADPANRKPPRPRECFVKYDGLSHWHCDWVPELQIEVFHKILWRMYTNRTDMANPPTWESLQEANDAAAGDESSVGDAEPQLMQRYYDQKLEETFYRNGIKPQWLRIHRILNHKKTSKSEWYLIKWRDLSYDMATWELDNGEVAQQIADWKKHVDIYWSFKRNVTESDHQDQHGGSKSSSRNKSSNAKGGRRSKAEMAERDDPTSNQTSVQQCDAKKRYEKQPEYIDATGGRLHEYQLEGLNWLRFSWKHGTDVILADEMGLGKTIQTVTFLYSLFKENHTKGPFIVSAPLSTLINWEREFEFWAPDMYVVTYVGGKEARAVIREHEFSFDENAIKAGQRASKVRSGCKVKFHVLLTSYEMICMDSATLGSVDWEILVVDEAHRLKSNVSKFFRTLFDYSIK